MFNNEPAEAAATPSIEESSIHAAFDTLRSVIAYLMATGTIAEMSRQAVSPEGVNPQAAGLKTVDVVANLIADILADYADKAFALPTSTGAQELPN
jgi:hypothetical protein